MEGNGQGLLFALEPVTSMCEVIGAQALDVNYIHY